MAPLHADRAHEHYITPINTPPFAEDGLGTARGIALAVVLSLALCSVFAAALVLS